VVCSQPPITLFLFVIYSSKIVVSLLQEMALVVAEKLSCEYSADTLEALGLYSVLFSESLKGL